MVSGFDLPCNQSIETRNRKLEVFKKFVVPTCHSLCTVARQRDDRNEELWIFTCGDFYIDFFRICMNMLYIYILYNGTFVLDFCPAICSCPDPALESSLQRFPKFVLSQPSRGDKSWQVHSRTSAKRYPVHCFSRFWCPPEGLFLTTSLYDCWAHGFKKRPYVRVFASKILWHIIPCMVWLPTFFAILVVKKRSIFHISE